MAPPQTVNALQDALERGQFFVTIEYCLPPQGESLASLEALADYAAGDRRIGAIALTDRVTSEHDYDPVDVAPEVLRRAGKVPLVHLSGKDCTPDDVERRLRRCAEGGLSNVLIVTGDMPRPPKGEPVHEPDKGFTDSVQAVHIAGRHVSGLSLIASAVSSFKYTEPELMNQYIKVHKKLAHGAQVIFNQVGYDLRKAQELVWYLRHGCAGTPAVAALYWLTPGFARFARDGNVPGVIITPDLCRLIEEICTEPDKGQARRTEMMVLHVLLCKRFGYAGVHVGGLKSPTTIASILDAVDRLDVKQPDTNQLWARWCELLRFRDGSTAQLGEPDGFYLFDRAADGLNAADFAPAQANGPISPRYLLLRRIHDLVFARGLRPSGVGERIVRTMARVPGVNRLGYWMERAVKTPLVGCQGCGSCSLPDTQYVCIESDCAKHLTNGPCGGQRDGHCEAYPERPCAWVEIYRRAKSQGELAILREQYVSPKDRSLRHSCSWMNLATGRDHHAAARAGAKADSQGATS